MHTSFSKGTPLYIKFRNGDTTTGKFKDHKSGKVILEDGRVIDISEVRAMSIRKLETTVSTDNKEKKVIFRSDRN